MLQAFSSFAEAAGSLERSYSLLRAEVGRLRRELEESNGGLARSLEENRTMRQHLDRILESLPCGVLVAAEDGKISRVNPEGRRLLAWESGPGADNSSDPVSVSGLRRELAELLERARTANGEQEQKISSGGDRDDRSRERWLAVRHAAVAEGTPSSSVFILRDISERKQLERAEQKLLREQALAEMSAVLAHEIRNPLGSLELFAGLLAEAELSAESREWVEHLRAGLRSLAATVNNVLNFHTQADTGRSPTDLGQLLDWAHDFLAPLARRARVEVRLCHRLAGVKMHADRHRLEQVLLNLLLNGLRAQPDGGCLELAGHTLLENEKENEAVIITVRDSGLGISPENLGKIFEAGFSTRVGSPGMGLAVCRKIVEQHGGSIVAESQAGWGAVFTLTFPLAEQTEKEQQEKTDCQKDREVRI